LSHFLKIYALKNEFYTIVVVLSSSCFKDVSSYACGGVDKLIGFFVVLIISEIDPSLIEQLVAFYPKHVLQLILVAKMKSKVRHLFDDLD
jgi:hypothetical protein